MKNLNRRVVLTLCAGSLALIFNPRAQAAADASEQGLQRVEWKVDGVAREALVYAPTTAKASSTASKNFKSRSCCAPTECCQPGFLPSGSVRRPGVFSPCI